MPLLMREMPSGPRMRTVAVGMPMLPQTTCVGTGCGSGGWGGVCV